MSIDTSLGSNLIVPVVLWGRHAPTHQISSIYVTPDQRTLVTGCADGHIITWNVHPTTFQVNPYMLLVGHTSRVTCMSDGLLNTSHKYLVSAAVNGEMCTWDLQEGQCIETIKMSFIHRQIQAYQSASNTDVTLFCCGEYADIALVHPLTLELIYWLSSRVSANWITSMHIFKPKAVADDVVMGVTVDGVVKIWTVSSGPLDGPSEGFHYENESKRIRCDDVRYLKCCSYNPRTVLVVTADLWQIYDACDFSLLCSYTAECDERWQQGEFLAADQVLVWAESGLAYVYNLPVNCIATHERFHSPSAEKDQPSLICRLSTSTQQQRFHEPSCSLFVSYRGERRSRLLVRGDCTGQVAVWQLPQHKLAAPSPDPQSDTNTAPALSPSVQCSIQQAWNSMRQLPVGILDQLETEDCSAPRLTASLYLPLQEGHLVCGREDGSIIIVPATHTIMLHLLLGKHQNYDNWPIHQILSGHRGPVTSLLYPHSSHPRYHLSELVSGGEDFSVCLWDLLSGTLLHRFVVQAGVITQLHVPPDSVSPRIQQCVCSVAADHSVALLSVKERRCLMLAGRHLFPVLLVKWRPLDDFLVVETEDGSVSVWQMETGHLDRVVYGTTAQDVLSACDEHAVVVATSDGGMANPAVHLFRGLRHRNLAAIRHAAKRGLQQLQNQHGNMHGSSDQHKSRSSSLMVQGLRTNARDPDCHVLFFDVESLIVDLLSEAYSAMSPAALEELGLVQFSEFQKFVQLTRSQSPDATQKISEFLGRMKHKAGDVEKRIKQKDSHGYLSKMKELKEQSGAIREHLKERAEGSDDLKRLRSRAQQAKSKLEERIHKELDENAEASGLLARVKEGAETMGGIIHTKTATSGKIDDEKDVNGEALRANVVAGQTVNQTMEICQILLSLVHSWGVDAEIDKLCETRLGLLRPKLPVSYGLISKHGFMSLLLPTFLGGPESTSLQERTRAFTRRTHWELSCALTTNHLLAVIALANTLMSVNHSSFLPPNERHRKLQKQLARTHSTVGTQINGGKIPQDGLHELQANFWAQVKEGWSRMAALHCVHFPERMETGGVALKKPLVEILAIKWQDRCIEIRQAAQALLLAELHRLSTRALKAVVDAWASLLPSYGDQLTASTPQPSSSGPPSTAAGAVVSSPALSAAAAHTAAAGDDVDRAAADAEVDDFIMEDQMEEEAARRAAANAAEARRKQATAVILLGVIGAEFGQEVSSSCSDSTSRTFSNAAAAGDRVGQNQTTPAVEGFGLGPLALHTSQALAHLLLAAPSAKLPAHTPLRRAAIDLIGRGFTQWEPHIDASRVLLAMLELCCEAHNLAPSMSYGLPLTPAADTARTARHAVALIAKARPHVFITTMAREVARYNTLQQNAQPLNVVVQHTVLVRARAEILRVTQLLIDTMHHQLMPFLIELTDILLHCLDSGHLRQRGLAEVFPAINRFNQITHCTNTRRLAVGTTAGVLAIYDLRQTSKTQLSAHSKAVTACAFSPDGKFLASYSTGENKISFWQTSTGMFGLGHAQTRCVKTYSTPPLADIVRMNPPRQPRLVWIANKTVTALLSDGTEQRYNV